MKDSNSIVALSVSISARISPSSTLSPTFLSHVATVPSVMVSLRRGIVTTLTSLGNSAAGAFFSSAFGAASSFFSSAAGAAGALPPFRRPEISSPSLPMIARSESTGADSPSCIPI